MTKKDKIQLGVTAVLLVILIVGAVNVFRGQKPRRPAPVPAVAVKKEPAVKEPAPANKEKSAARRPEQTQTTSIERDPFSKPDVPVQPARQGLRLDGIAFDDETPTAIINGKIVKVGSAIENYFVISITEDSVILSDGSNVVTLLTDY